jgi:uncharacterized protein (TIGR03663 family)
VKVTTPAAIKAPQMQISDRTWTICSVVILLAAAFLRLYDLDLVPLHHDEGVNGNFLVRLVREGAYQYDPGNYHGPTLYYFSAIIPWIIRFIFGPSAQNSYGLTTFMIRMVPGLFGIGTVGLILLLRRRLGSIGTLSAAGLLAISPGAVYLSRYFIHETLFVFFTIAIVVAVLRYYEDGHPIYLMLALISTALLFATKETAFVSGGVLLLAVASTYCYLWLTRQIGWTRSARRKQQPSSLRSFVDRAGGKNALAVWGLIGLVVFVAVYVLFYSSFFTNFPKGVTDSLKTFEIWSKTGRRDHIHPWTTYIKWLSGQESPLLFLGSVGAVFVLLKPKNIFALFSSFWAFGLIAAYSLIGYKTPWLLLSFIVPLALIAGYAFQVVYETHWAGLRAFIMVAVIALAISGYQTIDLNFFNYDNDDQYYVYVYAHTRRETLKLVDDINRFAQRTPTPSTTGITIASRDYWPLPWYLRDYTRVGYHGAITNTDEPIIIASQDERAEVLERFSFRYQLIPSGLNEQGSYPLRPGVELLLLVKRDLAQPVGQ